MTYNLTLSPRHFTFPDLRSVMACASPPKSGDELAGIAAGSAQEREAARQILADLPLSLFLEELLIPYEADEVTRLIVDSHDAAAFAPVSGLSVGEFRDWLLAETRPDRKGHSTSE